MEKDQDLPKTEAFQSPWNSPHRVALDYEFTTEIAPGVWKVVQRHTRVEYLAYDITNRLFANPDQPWRGDKTDLWDLLQPDSANGYMNQLGRLLTHENLVCFVDVINVRKTNFGGPYTRERWYTIWDFCDAGNLGNLLFPDLSPPKPRIEEVDDADDDDANKTKDNKTKFLPESLCWHVLTSVLKALAWLHDGTTHMEMNQRYRMAVEMGQRDPDWQPILHRNITPTNIFFMHPKRGETYGFCKLGNYGDAFVTGHNAVSADQEPDARQGNPPPKGPHGRYIIGPPKGQRDVPLEELREKDLEYADAHPPFADQPYTLLSEYRALGEVLQAMMVPPDRNGGDHMERIRTRSVRDNLQNADYSPELVHFVQSLMEMSVYQLLRGMEEAVGHFRDFEGYPLISNLTSALYVNALRRYYAFRRDLGPEAPHTLIAGEAVDQENNEDAWRASKANDMTIQMNNILDKQDIRFGDTPKDWVGNPKPTGNQAGATM